MQSKLQEYYKALDKIALVNSDVDKKREELKKIVDSFYRYTQSISVDKQLLEQNQELGSLLEKTTSTIKNATSNWIDEFNALLEKEKFRSELENYFIVIIFGKVKAGKSSLGNFIAQNRLENQEIKFFKYDEAGKEQTIKKLEEINDDGFATANLECTVEIQGFKLSSMAWIDTPGLGSMVEENGELAKEYIQSADYIIYPTNSSSPLQQDEKAQLKELFEQNKKVTICITKSDDTEEDECECGSEDGCPKCNNGIVKILVNKSQERREAQEKWVKNELNDILEGKKDSLLGDIISISVHTAKAGLEKNDEELFKNSNIEKFYSLMQDVVEKKAKVLKEHTPYDGLKSFIDNEILGSNLSNGLNIATLKNSILNFEEQIQNSIDEFQRIKESLNTDITIHIDSVVAKYASEIDKSNATTIFNKIDSELNELVSKMIEDNIQKIMGNFNATLNSLKNSLSSSDNFNIEDKYETIKVRYDNTGAIRNILNKVTFGLVEREYKTIKEEVYVGDNKNEMIVKFKKDRLDGFIKVAKENYESVEKDFFHNLKQISSDIKTHIQKLTQEVEQFKNNLQG